METTLLAVLCGKVAEEPSLDESTREKARHLKVEWAGLQNPPSSNLLEEQERNTKRQENHRKMTEFLADLVKTL